LQEGHKELTDAQVTTEFKKFYLQRATQEFAEDLDKVRGADDFREGALPLLINALSQGTSTFSREDQRRIVEAGREESKRE
jgi:ribosome assembly protein 3